MKYLYLLLALVILFYAYQFWLMYHRINVGTEIANNTVAYTQDGEVGGPSILMIGDSTALGVGASLPELSLAGLVGAKYPQAKIVNLGRNGMKVGELVDELKKIQGQKFDLVMLHIGGNDIVRFTDLGVLESSIADVFTLTSALTSNITSTVTGNMGTATLFPYGSGWVLEKRTRQVHQLFIDASKKYEALYVDLFLEKGEDPFAKYPDKYYAADVFHPSENGYALWFESISKQLDKIKFNN